MKKVYVGGLSYSVTKEALADEFRQFGNVEDAVVISDQETGRSRGFGFVTFADQASAQSALAYDGKEWLGRKITVNMAKDKPAGGSRSGGGGGRSGGGGGRSGGGNGGSRW
ncbi:MAG: RNA recognition motif domain-containing protein [Gammaproteobacteria bacterium]